MALIVFSKILVVLLLVALGFTARRVGWLDANATQRLSRFAVDAAFPALVFVHLLRTVDVSALRASWTAPVLGGGVLLVSWVVGRLVSRLVAPAQRGTFTFVVGTPNWIFLPLLIIDPLFGDAGVRTVLLFNVGAQIVLWTVGVQTLRGGTLRAGDVLALFKNPGLLATVLGLVVAIYAPQVKGWATMAPDPTAPFVLVGGAALQAMALLSTMAIPLALVITGAQLGAFGWGALRPRWALFAVLLGRLVLAPLVLVGAALALNAAGLVVPPVIMMVALLVSAMPAAVSCSLFAARFGGDVELAATAVLHSTVWSLVSVPGTLWALERVGVLRALGIG